MKLKLVIDNSQKKITCKDHCVLFDLITLKCGFYNQVPTTNFNEVRDCNHFLSLQDWEIHKNNTLNH